MDVGQEFAEAVQVAMEEIGALESAITNLTGEAHAALMEVRLALASSDLRSSLAQTVMRFLSDRGPRSLEFTGDSIAHDLRAIVSRTLMLETSIKSPPQSAAISSRASAKGDSKSHIRPWVDSDAEAGICLLALDDRKGNLRRLRPLPQNLYSHDIAPFLRFEGPVANQLYVIGGRDEKQAPLNTVEMFNTWTGTWVTCPPLLSKRAGSAAAALPDGKLLMIGGYDERGIVEGLLDSCEAFDPSAQSWLTCSHKLGRARWGHGAAVINGLLYAVGGCSLRPGTPPHEAFMETLRCCEVLDCGKGTWSPCGDLHIARAGARVVSLGDRYIAAVGGCDDVFGRAEVLLTVELYDTMLGKWALLQNQLLIPRTTAAVAALDEQHILIIGGAPSLSSGELYRVNDERSPSEELAVASTEIADIAEGRMGCQAVSLKLPAEGKSYPVCEQQCVVVIGGENGEDDTESHCRQFSSVLVYETDTKRWRPEAFPDIPTPRTAMALCVGPGIVW